MEKPIYNSAHRIMLSDYWVETVMKSYSGTALRFPACENR